MSDSREPEWQTHVSRYIELWKRHCRPARSEGRDVLTITPEFGPPNDMHTVSYTNAPVSDKWEVNGYIDYLLWKQLQT